MATYPKITPTDPRVAAFREVVALLRSSVHTRSVVKTWKSWTDSDDSALEPTLDQLPCVRVTPFTGNAERRAGRGIGKPASYRQTLRIELECYTPGPRVDDLGNLWGRIESALFGTTDQERAAIHDRLGAVGARDMTLVRPAIPQAASGYGPDDLVASAEIELEVWFDL